MKGIIIMAKRCAKCGTFLTDAERFCPNCGENVNSDMPAAAPVQQYQQYQQQGIQPPPISYTAPAEPPMTLKRWIGTLLLTNCLGMISIILLFVWGFGSGPKERQDYCKAMLIVKAILIVVGFILVMIFSAAILSSASAFTDWAERIADSADDFYTSAASLFSFIG